MVKPMNAELERILAKRDAASELNISEQTAERWHDLVQGPRDTAGRRIYTETVVEQIREQREGSRSASSGQP